ncbi:MAG: diacylglycerol kinase family protein [Prolixibacteraceae bacterium]|nr:diacylglycerol kinase family protein [Prolixibacteraceae bacterium]
MRTLTDFIIERSKSIIVAIKGMFLLIRTEHAIMAQSSLFLIFTAMGFILGISRIEWIIQFSMIGLILATEGMNTAVEKLCDFIHPEYHKKIGFIKDISAGAVLFAVFFSIINAILIYYPHIFK